MPYALTQDVTIETPGELKIGGLPFQAGDKLRVFIIPEPSAQSHANRYPLHNTAIRYDGPFEPAVDPDEWEANR